MLNGLEGRGRAKVYVPEKRRYEITVANLSTYVKDQVKARKHNVTQNDKAVGDLIQVPQGKGNLDVNPTLVIFEPKEFADETLTVDVKPGEIVPHAGVAITVWSEDPRKNKKRDDIRELPLVFRLPPRRYWIGGVAGRLTVKKPVDLYEPYEVIVDFASATVFLPYLVPKLTPSGPGESTRDLWSKDATMTAALTVESTDPLTPLELVDALGTVVERQSRKLVRLDLKPGLYRALLRTPEGEAVEQEVALTPGDVKRIRMKRRSP